MRFWRYSFTNVVIAFVFFLTIHPQIAFAISSSDTLLGYWKFDETSVSLPITAADSSGDGFTGTPAPSGAPPMPNTTVAPLNFTNPRSMGFSGGSHRVLTNLSISNLGAFTLAGWIYPTSAGTNIGFMGQNGAIQFGFSSATKIICNTGSMGSIEWTFDNSTFPLSTWHHVACVGTGTSLSIYVDGVSKATDNTTGSNYGASADKVNIGGQVFTNSASGGNFIGDIDDVRIYSRALSQTELTAMAAGNFTSSTWTGGTSTSYETGSNWNISAVPDSYTRLTIGTGTFQPTLTTSETVTGLTINSSATLTLAGNNATIQSSGTFSNNGSLALQGGETLSGFSNDTDSGTIIYNGSGTYSSLPLGNNYYDLTFNGAGTWTPSTAVDVNGSVSISSGIVISPSGGFTVAGSWTNSGGTFTAGTSTVTLDGSNQSISGSNTFYNLTKSISSADTLTFSANSTQTITNILTLGGIASNLLSLRSSSPGTQWTFDPQGTRNITYVDTNDSNNTNVTPIAYSSTISYGSNLTNWITPTPAPSSNSSNSSSGCGVTPAGTPNLFQINTGKKSAVIYFSPVGRALNYFVSYGLNSNANQYSVFTNQGASTGVLSYTINSLPANTTLYFKLYAQNNCGQGNWSNVMKVKTTGAMYYKNIISQILSIIPQKTTVLGSNTSIKIPDTTSMSKKVSTSKSVVSYVKKAVSSPKKSCFFFVCR